MRYINLTSAGSIRDFDHCDGWASFFWETNEGFGRTLNEDVGDDKNVEFVCDFDDGTYRDLEYLHNF